MGGVQNQRGSDGFRTDFSLGVDESRHDVGQLGWTKQELLDVSGLSGKSFDMMRKAARVSGPRHGALTHVFNQQDLMTLIEKAESGRFSERGGIPAAAWRVLLTEAGIKMPTTISKKRR